MAPAAQARGQVGQWSAPGFNGPLARSAPRRLDPFLFGPPNIPGSENQKTSAARRVVFAGDPVSSAFGPAGRAMSPSAIL